MSNNSVEFSMKYNEPSYSLSHNSSVTLSQQTSRFWIPFDVKLFETMTPLEYLEKYCRVHQRRYLIYKRLFDKHRDIENQLNIENLPDALSEAYMDTIEKRLMKQMINVIDLPSDTKLTFAQFRGIAAFSERYFFNILSRSSKTIDSQLKKDVLEILDFSSLKWKLFGIQISPNLRALLDFL